MGQIVKIIYKYNSSVETPYIASIEVIPDIQALPEGNGVFLSLYGIEWLISDATTSEAYLDIDKLKLTKQWRKQLPPWDKLSNPYYIERKLRKNKLENL